MKKILVLIFSLLILTSCSNNPKNCDLIGRWRSIEFYSDKPIDANRDGVYNKDLLKEYDCTVVIYDFMENGKVKRLSKSKRTKCKFNKSPLNYTVDGDQITFTVSGMKQKHKFEIKDCKLHIYGIYGSGMTKSGKKSISIHSVFEKE